MHRHFPEAAPMPPTFDPWQAYVVAAEVSMAGGIAPLADFSRRLRSYA